MTETPPLLEEEQEEKPTPNRPTEALNKEESRPSVPKEVIETIKQYFRREEDLPFEPPSEEFIENNFFDISLPDSYEEISRYWVNKPFSFIGIYYDRDRKDHFYRVFEPDLDQFERYVRQDLVTLLRNNLMYLDFERYSDREPLFVDQTKQLIRKHAATVDPGSLHKILYFLMRDFLHYGKIDPLMRDDAIEDISCDGVDIPVFVYHRELRDLETNIEFRKQELNSFTVRLAQRAGRQLSVSNPLVDASLPDGSRIQLTLGGSDVATRGSNFTIRKFAEIPYTPVDLVGWNTFDTEQMAYFWLAIENNKSLIFAGGTGSGKTTSMNAVSLFIPPTSKIVTIEDTREFTLPHQNWIASVTRSSASGEGRGEVSMYNLLQAALRQRPEYLLVGEIRTEQSVALTFFQAMGTGHTAYTTVHADSIETVLGRLQNPPLNVPSQMIQDLDIVSIQRQTFIGDSRVRRNDSVWELSESPSNPNEVGTNEIFRWDPRSDTHNKVGESDVMQEIASDRGWDDEELAEQIAARERVIEYLIENEYHGYEEVSSTIHMFHRNPESIIKDIKAGEFDPSSHTDSSLDETEEIDSILEAHDTVTDEENPPRSTGNDGSEEVNLDEEPDQESLEEEE